MTRRGLWIGLGDLRGGGERDNVGKLHKDRLSESLCVYMYNRHVLSITTQSMC